VPNITKTYLTSLKLYQNIVDFLLDTVYFLWEAYEI